MRAFGANACRKRGTLCERVCESEDRRIVTFDGREIGRRETLKDQNQEKFLWRNLGPMGVYRRESRYHGEICSLFFCAMPTARDTAGANF